MALLDINLKPSDKMLKDFGKFALFVSVLIAAFNFYKGFVVLNTAGYIVLGGVLVFVASLISTFLIRPIYITMVVVTFPIGWAISHLILAFFYYCMITPLAIFFKLTGRDIMHRTYDKACKSYWIKHETPTSLKQYKQQF